MGHGTHIFGYIQTIDNDKKAENEKSIRDFKYDDPWPFIDAFGNFNEHYWGGIISYGIHMRGDEPSDIALWLKGFHNLLSKLDGFRAEIHVVPEIICPKFYRTYHKLNEPLSYIHFWGERAIEVLKINESFDPFLSGNDEDIWNSIKS